MKTKFIFLVLMFGLFLQTNAQTISTQVTAIQYYFNTDPGVGVTGNGAIVPVTPADTIDQVFSISVSGLANGLHNLYVRAKDENGNWSGTERRLFFIDNFLANNIVAYQYYFDTDPGVGIVGNGGLVSITSTSNFNQIVTIALPGSLANGIHNLYVRFLNDDGNWSIAERRLFFIDDYGANNIVAYQYYFDTDPGVGIAGNGAITSITATTNFSDTLAIPVNASLTAGIHNFYVRVKNDLGRWSIAERRLFLLDNLVSTNIAAYQYYFDTDPGVGIAGNGGIVNIADTSNFNALISIPLSATLTTGIHNLYIRTVDDNGHWSIAERRLFFIANDVSSTIVKLEYFYDSDPGVGNGTDIPVSANDSVIGNFAIYLPSIAVGAHQFFVRAKDSDGHWSVFERASLTALSGVTPSLITANSDTTFCVGDSVVLHTGAAVGIIYQWLKNNIVMPGETDTIFTATTSGNYSIIATDTATALSDTSVAMIVTAMPYVTPTITISANYSIICANTNVLFTANVANGGSSPLLQWILNGANIGPNSINYSSSTLSNNDEIKCSLISNNMCQTASFALSDSIVMTVNLASSYTQMITICNGDAIIIGGVSHAVAGNYVDTLINFKGCDSIVNTGLSVELPNAMNLNVTLCNGSSLMVGSSIYSSSGIYVDTLISFVNGCDSIITSNLTINSLITTSQSLSICFSDTVYIGIHSYFSNGVYTDTLFSFEMCDSVVTTTLTVNPQIVLNAGSNQTFCHGDSVSLVGTGSGGSSSLIYMWNDGVNIYMNDSIYVSPADTTTFSLSVSDASCSATANVTLNVKPSTDIYGVLTASFLDTLSGGQAELYSYKNYYVKFERKDLQGLDVITNEYHFANVDSGLYIIKGYSDNAAIFPYKGMPTYYDADTTVHKVVWDYAMPVTHGCSTIDTFDIDIKLNDTATGPSFITGTIYSDSGYVRNQGEPVPGLDVKMGHNPGGQGMIVYNTTTVASPAVDSGHYYFNNIPDGNYFIYVDIPGLKRDTICSVIVLNNTAANIDYRANDTAVYCGTYNTVAVKNENEIDGFEIYPNPASSTLTLDCSIAHWLIGSSVKLENMLGQMVYQTEIRSPKFEINVRHLAKGIYTVVIESGKGKMVKKLVVQ